MRLTPQMRTGITRIIEADLCGWTLDSLLESGPGQMCAHSTYYGPHGWSHKPDFVECLRLARELSFDDRLRAATRRARERIVMAAPDAADKLVTAMGNEDIGIALRAAESVLNRTSKATADQSPINAVVTVTADDLAAARDAAAAWEKEHFGQ